MSQQKATGWKVPLLFCAVMGVAVLGTWLWRNLERAGKGLATGAT